MRGAAAHLRFLRADAVRDRRRRHARLQNRFRLRARGSPVGGLDFFKQDVQTIVDDVCEKIESLVQLAASKDVGAEATAQAATFAAALLHLPVGADLARALDVAGRHQARLRGFDTAVVNAILRILAARDLSDADRAKLVRRMQLDSVFGGGVLPSMAAAAPSA